MANPSTEDGGATSGELADRDRCYAEQVYLTLRLIHGDLFEPALEFTLRMVGSKVPLDRVRGLLAA